MIKSLSLILLGFQLIQVNAQETSTTDLYTAAIDLVLEMNGLENNNELKLIMAQQFYDNNIKTYKGKYNITYLSGFRNGKKEWAGKELVYLYLSPIKISNSELFIMVEKSTVSYKSKRKWKLNDENQKFYYTFFKYDPESGTYIITRVEEGKFCPNTVN